MDKKYVFVIVVTMIVLVLGFGALDSFSGETVVGQGIHNVVGTENFEEVAVNLDVSFRFK